MCPDKFFSAIAASPVGANPNGLGAHALHEDANEDKANVFHRRKKMFVEALLRSNPSNPMYKIRAYQKVHPINML